jgi:hypothetical protein
MPFEYVDSLSLPGDAAKPNEDAFAFEPRAAAVFDGATGLGEKLLPGPSDAAWIARLGADRVLAHVAAGIPPQKAVRLALHDACTTFAMLRLREPAETWEIPFASMMFATETSPEQFEFNYFGDCEILVRRPGERCIVFGKAVERRAGERERVAALAARMGVNPAAPGVRDAFLPALRSARDRVNTEKGTWLFGPDANAADHVDWVRVGAPAGSLILLVTDGFFALATDYGRYRPRSLVRMAEKKGLAALGRELRGIENRDRQGVRYPRVKTSDDATALLLRVR